MQPLLTKFKWAYKLLMSKAYVVLTDKESAICLTGVKDPDTIKDTQILSGQAVAVEYFYQSLGELVKEHKKAIRKLNKEGRNAYKTRTSKV